MEKNILEISKPHYVDRFYQPPKHIKEKHRCDQEVSPSQTSGRQQTSNLNQTLSIQNQKIKIVRKLKISLLEMLTKSKQNWQAILFNKQLLIKNLKQEHKNKMETIFKQLNQIKQQTYEQFKHICNAKKEGLCTGCIQQRLNFKRTATEYLNFCDCDEEANSLHPFLRKGKHAQSKFNPTLHDKKKIKKIKKNQNPGQINSSDEEIQIIIAQQNDIVASRDKQNKHLDPFYDNATLNDPIFLFSPNRQKSKLLTINKRRKSRLTGQMSLNSQESQKNLENRKSLKQSQKRKNVTILLANNNRMFRTQTKPNEQGQNNGQKYSNTAGQFGYRRSRHSSTTRKSLIKLTQTIGDLQTTNFRSKFYELNNQTDPKLNDQIQINDRSTKQLKTYKGSDGTSKSHSSIVEKEDLTKSKKSNRNKKGPILGSEEQIMLDWEQTQSIKQHEEQWEPPLLQTESEKRIKQRKQYKKDQKNSKLSRYRREKLFYTMLKKQIAGCLSPTQEEEQAEQEKVDEPQIDISPPTPNDEESEDAYSILKRKQSFISKLNIFNQSVNFQDIRTKIEAFLQKKNDFFLQHGKQLIVAETFEGSQGTKHKILQKFLADVLKINDLKRLLKKKFSKERQWGQKMRQMHQFYTYLQYSLENFRAHLNKTEQNNWRQIGWEGNDAEFDVENLVIEENIGHYEGLENVELTEYEHHKQIQCSMKYYGIEVKKIQELKHLNEIDSSRLPQGLSKNVAQKSLKQIKEVPEQVLQASFQPQQSN